MLIAFYNLFPIFIVKEGAHLYDNGIDPYHGDVYHENPFVLIGSTFLLKNFGDFMQLIFVALDLLTAVFIYYATKGITKRNAS